MSEPATDLALVPLAAFDIRADGSAVTAPDTGPRAPDGFAYRWLHMNLTDAALAGWSAQNLPPLAARALLASKTRPRVDSDADGLVMTLRGINLNEGSEQADMVSLRLWLTPRLVVTVRRQRVFAMEALRDQMRAGKGPASAGEFLAWVNEALVDRIETVSLALEDLADDLEDAVYERAEDPPRDLPHLRRETIKLRRHVGPMSDALNDLSKIESPVVTDDLRPRLRYTANRARRSMEELSEVHERLTALADHLDIQQASRLERNGYRLSVAAAIFLPLGFLTGLFGVNVGGMPGTGDPMAFWWLTGGMVVLGLVTAVVLRLLRWF